MSKTLRRKLGYVLLIAIAIFFSYCSPKTNYKTLSFFFDGVPQKKDTDSTKVINTSNIQDTNSIPVINSEPVNTHLTIHAPYKEGNCSACHDDKVSGMFVVPQAQLCYTCHDDYGKKYAFVHGPVAAGFCSSCHSGHSSELPKLLKREGQSLCLNCHEAASVLKNEAHDEIGETACTDCHFPHGGKDHHLLNYYKKEER